MNRFARWIATCGPIGHLPQAPGTFASLLAVPAVFLVQPISLRYLFLLIFLIPVAIWSSGVAMRDLGVHDPKSVVIDEVCGMLVSFFAISITWKTLVIGFFLFRFFDVVKLLPIRQLERIPYGFGIVLDDVLAGFYANVILRLLGFYGIL